MMVRAGVFRTVLLVGSVAIKVPNLRKVTAGMRCNRWEREMWRIWRPKFGWENLCPIGCADPLGLIVIMSRAEQPVSTEEMDSADTDDYPDIHVEFDKPANWGRLPGGRIVAVDYGLWDADSVRERRAYLAGKTKR